MSSFDLLPVVPVASRSFFAVPSSGRRSPDVLEPRTKPPRTDPAGVRRRKWIPTTFWTSCVSPWSRPTRTMKERRPHSGPTPSQARPAGGVGHGARWLSRCSETIRFRIWGRPALSVGHIAGVLSMVFKGRPCLKKRPPKQSCNRRWMAFDHTAFSSLIQIECQRQYMQGQCQRIPIYVFHYFTMIWEDG